MQENQHTEWKESWRDEYLRWVCGFANAEGGVLVIGRNDQGEVSGLKDARKLLEDLPNKVRDVLGIMVDVNLRKKAGLEYIEIVVPAYPNAISFRGEYFYRSGSTNQMLKGAALSRFLLRKQGLHWDGVVEPKFSMRKRSTQALAWFRKQAAKAGRVDPAVLADSDEALLGNLQLLDAPYVKRAATLLFFDQPEAFVLGAFIKIGFFVTDDDLRYQDEVHGDLFTQVEKALEILRQKYLKAYISYQGLQRLETFLFPIQGLREALLNAVIHKDYSSGIPIQISVYEHQIVLWNPGQLPEHWTVKKLLGKHPSTPFNPLLALAFFRAGYVESWGRGIEKIASECRAHGIKPPAYDASMSGLMLTFRANANHLAAAVGRPQAEAWLGEKLGKRLGNGLGESLGDGLGEKLGESRAAILKAMHADPKVTIRKLAALLNISTTAIEKNIEALKARGYVQRIGSAKGGHWKLPGLVP